MNTSATDRVKVCAEHQERVAFVYVRQSCMRQVRHNLESQRLQYGFAEQAAHLGWSRERIVIIDEDQGQSGSLPQARCGFGGMVAAVARGEAGIVMSLELSRLSRNDLDWHHLVYLCRWTNTLIADKCDAFRNVELTCENCRPIGAETRFCSTFLMQSSESLQPGNELGVMTPGSCFGLWLHEWLGFRQSLAFCFQIESQILVGSIDAGMAQPMGNGAQVVACTQQI
jgi:Resolvase, N terminal domain